MSLSSDLRKKADEHREIAVRAFAAGLNADGAKHLQWADDLDEQAEALENNEK